MDDGAVNDVVHVLMMVGHVRWSMYCIPECTCFRMDVGPSFTSLLAGPHISIATSLSPSCCNTITTVFSVCLALPITCQEPVICNKLEVRYAISVSVDEIKLTFIRQVAGSTAGMYFLLLTSKQSRDLLMASRTIHHRDQQDDRVICETLAID